MEQQKITKPDVDNVAKIFLDAMNEVVFVDDKAVTTLLVKKVWAVGREAKATSEIEVFEDLGEELRGGRLRNKGGMPAFF